MLAVLVLLIRPGKHGDTEATARHRTSAPLPSAPVYFRREALMMLKFFGAIGLVNLSFGGVATWMPVVAVRTIGATPAEAGGGMGVAAMAGSIAGCVLSGLVAGIMRARFGVLAPYDM